MKNITVTVPNDVFRRARVAAALADTSVSALVTQYLRSLTEDDAEFNRLADLQWRTMAQIDVFSGADRLERDEVHERAVR